MPLQNNPIPNGTINNQVVTFNFPDATYTLKSFKQSGRKLIAYFAFENTNSQREGYSNSFSFDVLNLNGLINSIEFKLLSSVTSPLS